MRFVNLMPRPIVIRLPDGPSELVPPSGKVARVSVTPGQQIGTVAAGVPVFQAPVLGEVEGLPEPSGTKAFLVSTMVAQQVNRPDVFSPGTGPADGAIRDEKGNVVAVTRLISSFRPNW